MGTEKKDRSIFVKDVLRAVAVMNVPIDDGDMLGSVDRLRMARGDGDVIENAKAHAARLARVMAWRANGTKRIVDFAPKNGVNRGDGTASGPASRIGSGFANVGVTGAQLMKAP